MNLKVLFSHHRWERAEDVEERVMEKCQEVLPDNATVTGCSVHLGADYIDVKIDKHGATEDHIDHLNLSYIQRLREELGLVCDGVMESSLEGSGISRFRVWLSYKPEIAD